jgi:hypothetical protein
LNQEIKEKDGVTVHQATAVKWLSSSDSLESVIKSFKTIQKLLTDKEKQQFITDLNLQY